LIGPGFESAEPAGLLALFEQRSVLAARAPSGRRRRTRPELAPVFPSFRPAVVTAFGCGGDGAQIPCCRGRWHKQVFAAERRSDSMSWGRVIKRASRPRDDDRISLS